MSGYLITFLLIIVIIVLLRLMNTPHTIIVSMTCIPERIEDGKLDKTVESIFLQTFPVHKLYINIPRTTLSGKQYPRDKLENLKVRYPFIVINYIENDMGPITKLIPTLKYLNNDEIIVLIDDDVIYGENMIKKLVDSDLSAVGYAGRDNDLNYIDCDGIENPVPCAFLETYAGVLYKSELFYNFENYYKLLLEKHGDICIFQDDIVIGKFFEQNGEKRWVLNTAHEFNHDGSGTPELNKENLGNDKNKLCFDTIF